MNKRRSEVEKALDKFAMAYSENPPTMGSKWRRDHRSLADKLIIEWLTERLEKI